LIDIIEQYMLTTDADIFPVNCSLPREHIDDPEKSKYAFYVRHPYPGRMRFVMWWVSGKVKYWREAFELRPGTIEDVSTSLFFLRYYLIGC
jgi:hypothetical protein